MSALAAFSENEASKGERDALARQATVARLKAQLAAVHTAPRQYVLTLSTGVPALDALGVFRLGAGVEVTGQAAGGKASLGLSLVASACRARRLAAWVDGPKQLYPPAGQACGVDLQRLLVVRPPSSRQLVWATVQVLRSGAFACVVLDVSHTGVAVGMTEAKKLIDAARTGGALLVVLTAESAPAAGLMRVSVNSTSPRHLSVVSKSDEGLPDEVVLTVQRAATSSAHRQVRWRRLWAPAVRAHRVGARGLAVPFVEGGGAPRRVKKNELRDGYGGLSQQHACWGGSGRAPRVTAAQQGLAGARSVK